MEEIEGGSGETVQKNDVEVDNVCENDDNNDQKKRKKASRLLRFGCLKIESDEKGGVDMEVDFDGKRREPTHLVIMVNGIIGSAQNWRYAAKQFLKKYPEDLIVHCSERNSATLTFDGVDVMGGRLADEVISVIKRHPGVQKISFIGHSLGGLVARYAIALLYERDLTGELYEICGSDNLGDSCLEGKFKGKIAGLEPMNFITSASPHLGSRWHKQVPLFCGFYTLEKVAARTSWFLGRTGKHLFLTDRDNGKPPLLLQMVSDCEDLKFMSALQSFRRRVVYANARFDYLVGWSTSSLRHRNELPKVKHLRGHDRYPHIVNVEAARTGTASDEVPSEAKFSGWQSIDLEEQMIRSLTRLSWERIDVNFKGTKQRFLAHNTIQVKNYCINSAGADVVQHMIDNFLL